MKSRFTFCLLFILFECLTMNAGHIIGGSAGYEVIMQSQTKTTLNMNFTLYREAIGGGSFFDNPALFGVYGVTNNQYTYVTRINAVIENVDTLNFEYPADCPELFYEKGSYTFEVSLFNSAYDSYVIAYQRCCRSGNISNIVNPLESGFALSINIYPKAFEYTEKVNEVDVSTLPFLLNVIDEHEVDLSFDDTYVKEYNLTKAKVAGGIAGVIGGDPTGCDGVTPNPILCLPPFDSVIYTTNDDYPYGFESTVNLDKQLGEFSIHIPTIGATLFEMTVDRYIDGELLSSINYQWTTISSACNESVSIYDGVFTKDVKLSPNPSTNAIQVSSSLTNIVILDVLGRQVMSIKKIDAKEEISIASINSGTYILRGTNENGKLINLQFIKSNI